MFFSSQLDIRADRLQPTIFDNRHPPIQKMKIKGKKMGRAALRANKDFQNSLNIAQPRAEPFSYASRRQPSNLMTKPVQPATDENQAVQVQITRCKSNSMAQKFCKKLSMQL